jgi:hypothetical protein
MLGATGGAALCLKAAAFHCLGVCAAEFENHSAFSSRRAARWEPRPRRARYPLGNTPKKTLDSLTVLLY